MKLVDNAKHWYKMFSVQSNVINGAFLTTWGLLPPKFQDVLPVEAVLGIAVTILVLGTLGRLIKQESIQPNETNPS